MWNNDADGSFHEGGGGGFDNNSMFSSPAQQNEKSNKPKCVASVTIKQIIECPEEGLKIKDREVQVVQVVGIIRSVDVSSVKIKYIISDFTGSIPGYLYLDNEEDSTSTVVENTYCIMTGSVRSQGGSKHVMIFSMNPLVDFNQILEHMLTVVYMPLKLDSIGNATEEKVMKQEMASSYGGGAVDNYSSDIDPKYRRIFDVISRSMSENGMSMTEIQAALPNKVPVDQIRAALEYLVGEGHIFTTIDENHFKSIFGSY